MKAVAVAAAVCLLSSSTLCRAAPYLSSDGLGIREQGPYGSGIPSYGTRMNNQRDNSPNYEPFVVLPSGSRLPFNAHHRLISLQRRKSPISVQLPSGQTLQFSDCDDFLRKAPTSHLDGGQFVIPAESWPVEIAQEAMEAERAQHVHVELPSGKTMPYHDYIRAAPESAYYQPPSASPRHSELPTDVTAVYPPCSLNDIPDENLFIMLGGGQRLLYKVHEAIHCHYTRKLPFDVRLATGERERVPTYDELLKKALDPRFMDSSVRLAPDVSIPIQTYRAVVDAHRHGNVFVEYPDGRRDLYSEFVKRRDAAKKDSIFRDIATHEQLGQDEVETLCSRCSEDSPYGQGSGRGSLAAAARSRAARRRNARAE